MSQSWNVALLSERCYPYHCEVRGEIRMKMSKKDIANYLHRNHEELVEYQRGDVGGASQAEKDTFIVRGYVKTQLFLTAALSEVNADTVRGFQDSRWPLRAVYDRPSPEEVYRRQALLLLDFQPLNVDESKPLFTGLYLSGPRDMLYSRRLRHRCTDAPAENTPTPSAPSSRGTRIGPSNSGIRRRSSWSSTVCISAHRPYISDEQ